MTKVAIVILVTLVPTQLARLAWADDTVAKQAAKARLERGADLLVKHGYSGALLEFEDAYRIFPSPKIFFDIGLANVGLNRNPEALQAFQRFLAEATEASPESIARAKAQIEALLPLVAVVDIVCPTAGTAIAIDDTSVGRTPVSRPLYLDPGQHRLTARAKENDAPFVTTFAAMAGARVTVLVPPGAPPATARSNSSIRVPPPPLPPSSAEERTLVDRSSPADPAGSPVIYRRPWFWVAAAGVLAAASVTLWLTVGRSTSYPTSTLSSMSF